MSLLGKIVTWEQEESGVVHGKPSFFFARYSGLVVLDHLDEVLVEFQNGERVRVEKWKVRIVPTGVA